MTRNDVAISLNFKSSPCLYKNNRTLAGFAVFAVFMILITALLLPCFTLSASAASNEIDYYDELGTMQTYSDTYIEINSGNRPTTLIDGWYVVEGQVSYSEEVAVMGDVYLVLKDNCDLTISGGIYVANSLTIYAQSADENMGKLYADGTSNDVAGIGSGFREDGGSIAICGGVVTAVGSHNSAGIGSGYMGSISAIAISGGVVTATGGHSGAGIGSGYLGSVVDYIAICGGVVTATGGDNGAGIGGGNGGGTSGVIDISGGTIEATGGGYAAGIGGGCQGDSWVIDISNGVVTATGGDNGAGIGGGDSSSGGSIVISGGVVTATGGNNGAGIGGGWYGSGGVITICGGVVVAESGGAGAGIGGGRQGDGGDILVYGEDTHVTAYGYGGYAQDIGEGAFGSPGSVFVILPYGQLIGSSSGFGNTVVFSAVPVSAGDVVVDLPSPFAALGSLVVMSGVGPVPVGSGAKEFSVITSFDSEGVDFALSGYSLVSGSADTGVKLRTPGAFVAFESTGGVVRDFVVVSSDGGTWDYSTEVLRILSDGSYRISMNSAAFVSSPFVSLTDSIVVAEGVEAVIVLDGVGIDLRGVGGCAFMVMPSASVTLVLEGNSFLTSGSTFAGLGVPVGAELIVSDSSTGSLTVTGGVGGAGIGGGQSGVGGDITISGGTVTATGGQFGAGIGGGRGVAGGVITISGGTVRAIGGGNGGAGIGGGQSGVGGDITISGGTVTATGVGGGAGIGGGGSGGSGGVITISGGTVTANSASGAGGAGIGGGSSGGSGGVITISGGTVTATGNTGPPSGGGAGIGGGSVGSGGVITISGGDVTATGGASGNGAGIGGGYSGGSGDILVYGEATSVSAKRGG